MKEFEENWLKRINAFIDENLQNPNFQLMDLTKELGISTAQLYRRISKLTGISPNKYIRQIRLQKAKEILERGTYPTVRETAESVGYLQPEYFTKLFKKEFNVLPKDILKQ